MCNGNVGQYIGVGTPILNDIYPSNVQGIGMRIKIHDIVVPKTYLQKITAIQSEISFRVEITLIKIGDIPAVTIPSGTYAYAKVDDDIVFEYRFSGSSTPPTPKIPTCMVEPKSKNLSVKLGTHSNQIFTHAGKTTPSVPFSISLDCTGGDTGTKTSAYVTLTDTANPSNTSTTLSLDSNSKVAGLGVQILKDGTPLGFGPESTQVGSTNQWFAGSIQQDQTTLNIPLEARYVQTWSNVYGSGEANANATFTVSYE